MVLRWGVAALALAAPLPVGADATVRWADNGVPACVAPNNQQNPQIVADGAGGAIVTWEDRRNVTSDIFAQHVLANGAADPAWPAQGVPVCTATSNQTIPQIATDGAGGAIITWLDIRTTPPAVYAQRVLAGGTVDPAWPVNGVALAPGITAIQTNPRIVSDGAGGAIVTWQDDRNGLTDIYAQRITAGGVVAPGWPATGLGVCRFARTQSSPEIVTDGAGGAIVTWADARTSFGAFDIPDIYAQRVLASGVVDPRWRTDGVALCTATGAQFEPEVASDGAGGAIVTWYDRRVGQPADPILQDIYVQRVDSAGVVRWTSNGVALCTVDNTQSGQRIVPDGAGGAIVVWQDHRTGPSFIDVYAHHVLANGALDPAVPAQGIEICLFPGGQEFPQIVPDGAGGAIVTWRDTRVGGSYDIYAQRIRADGTIVTGWPEGGLPLCTDGSNQQNPQIATDGAGGAIVVWQDARPGGANQQDIYAQRFSDNTCAPQAGPPEPGTACGVVGWTNPKGGRFFDAVNWNRGVGPVPDGLCPASCSRYDARFATGGAAYAVDFAADTRAAEVAVAGGDRPTFLLAGNRYHMSRLTIGGAGSALTLSGGTIVADQLLLDGPQPGTMTIAGGGAALCGEVRVAAPGAGGTSDGRVTVQDGATLSVSGGILVGGPGPEPGYGILVAEEGCAACAASIRVDERGRLSTPGTAVVAAGGSLSRCPAPGTGDAGPLAAPGVCADTLILAPGAVVDSLSIEPGGVLFAAAQVKRDVTNSGTVSPGSDVNGVGVFPLEAGYTQTGSGVLVVDLGGNAPGSGHDVLRVAGAATLGGSLEWKLSGGYRPPIGTQFEVLVAHPRIGTFASVGADIDVFYTDTSVVLIATATTPALASFVSAETAPGRASLRWHVAGSEGPVTIRRDRGTGTWNAVAMRHPEGNGLLDYEDLDVTAGRYGYRLGLPSASGEFAAGEVWVEVPAAGGFGLAGVVPNPASGPLMVSFSLADARPARLELYDSAGRLVESRSVGSPQPGGRVLTLSPNRDLPPGVYVLQLTQGERRAARRVAVVR